MNGHGRAVVVVEEGHLHLTTGLQQHLYVVVINVLVVKFVSVLIHKVRAAALDRHILQLPAGLPDGVQLLLVQACLDEGGVGIQRFGVFCAALRLAHALDHYLRIGGADLHLTGAGVITHEQAQRLILGDVALFRVGDRAALQLILALGQPKLYLTIGV